MEESPRLITRYGFGGNRSKYYGSGGAITEMGRSWRKVRKKERIDDPIGGAWLVQEYGIDTAQPLRIQSGVAPTRSIVRHDGRETRLYQEVSRPGPLLAEHLEFMLKHELVHLELFSRLFERISGDEIAQWVRSRPTSMYARRAGFFYEWLTGETLDFRGVTKGAYVEALDPNRYLVGARADVPRWRVRGGRRGGALGIRYSAERDESVRNA